MKMRHDSLGNSFFALSRSLISSYTFCKSTDARIRTDTFILACIRIPYTTNCQFSIRDLQFPLRNNFNLYTYPSQFHAYTYNLIIIDKKYMLRYVYWDHTNTSQGYIDVRFFSFCYFFFFRVFITAGTKHRDLLRSHEIPRFLNFFFWSGSDSR